ncbi:putative PurR-regulated permease PerM [Paenibacillus shirakamiensis]|uniref:PurR-regulated permease PerM n=1 Tax=Paenibacillus shirakamiensis TaxID=1265935 RepID=A0ABS4JDS7_9BACL|nr:AI-2E family transporter [Paenibacillus shirakamiensis]MBP1999878.1 putative PurR-regulated permease PerM [Paenibacillus shirakamiensis]
MLLQNKFFRVCLGVIMILTIIYLLHEVNFVFGPIVTFVQLLIVPMTVSGFLYYLLRPIVHYLDKRHVNRMLSILLIYLCFGIIIAILFYTVWPPLVKQVQDFISNLPTFLEELRVQFAQLQKTRLFSMIDTSNSQISDKITNYVNGLVEMVTSSMTGVFSFITDFVVIIGTVPIILYYMLKEDERISPAVVRTMPRRFARDGAQVVSDIDTALSGFISGRIISALLLAVLSFVGFWMIGLPYPLLLALFGALFNFIPYVGAFLGAVPCVIVAFTVSPSMVLYVLIVIVIAQQVEGNLIAPYVYGKTINIHPLTTVILLLIGGEYSGILGMILVIPVYMIIKIVTVRIYRLFLSEKVEEIVD